MRLKQQNIGTSFLSLFSVFQFNKYKTALENVALPLYIKEYQKKRTNSYDYLDR